MILLYREEDIIYCFKIDNAIEAAASFIEFLFKWLRTFAKRLMGLKLFLYDSAEYDFDDTYEYNFNAPAKNNFDNGRAKVLYIYIYRERDESQF